MSSRPWASRRQQQRRACARIGHRLNPKVRNGARTRLARVFHLDEIRDAQTGNIQRGAVIAISVETAYLTPHPASPLHSFTALIGSAIGLRGLPTMRAGMRGASWWTRLEAQTHQMAFVTQESPNFPTNGRIVAVVAPAPTHSSSSARGFQGLEGLHREQGATMHAGEQQQDIAGQVGQGAVSLLVLAPTAFDLAVVQGQSFLIPGAFGMVFGQRILFLFKTRDLLLQLVDL